MNNQRNSTILQMLRSVAKLYSKGGFEVGCILADGQFTPMKEALGEENITLNKTAEDEYVGEVER